VTFDAVAGGAEIIGLRKDPSRTKIRRRFTRLVGLFKLALEPLMKQD
jgi:hypothetical protein